MDIGNEEISVGFASSLCSNVVVKTTGCSGVMLLLSTGGSAGSGLLENEVPGSATGQELPPETFGYTNPIPSLFPLGLWDPKSLRAGLSSPRCECTPSASSQHHTGQSCCPRDAVAEEAAQTARLCS